MTILDLLDGSHGDHTSVLSWLQSIADRNSADDAVPTVIPVAWMGRTSTDDQQDPTLSLPRQLENSRHALPAPFVIVAKFYDIESGRNDLDIRGQGHAHERFDIPIARDGGIADMLEEAKRPDRRFVAVVCESIERVARVSYFSTKIEYELAQVGVALLAADEGIRTDAVLRTGGERPKQATQILTRRVKQAISEWYVVNMLELSWDGAREHTRQGWNIGKPPYGYLAERHPHPVKAKREDGKVKTRLVPDPIRGPVVTQIFLWRALERLGAQDIADRLNLDLDRYPPPQPIPGKGRRAVGAWTKTSVLDLLANPKYTGYMVWNRRKRSRPERRMPGRVNPPSEWVWSPRPTHEPLVTRAIFDAATPMARLRQRSRFGAGPNAAHRQTRRSYLLRSYLVCELCERRMVGKTRRWREQETTYYACVTNPEHHRQQPWYSQHPEASRVSCTPQFLCAAGVAVSIVAW
jgi:site-specific DNA recombinase